MASDDMNMTVTVIGSVDLYSDLRRFIKRVADYSNDEWLAREADELVILYGNPDAKPPQGVINA